MSQLQVHRHRADGPKNLVGFDVGDVRYAVDIASVREIVNPLPFVTLPHAPLEVLGVADHRGQVLPIVNLRERFGLPTAESTRRTKWLVVVADHSDSPVALVVDSVTEVFGAAADQHRDIPVLGGGEDRRGISAAYKYRDGLVFVIEPSLVTSATRDIDRLLAEAVISKGGA
jgi:purine-binding chemotaxis protein CheW